MIDTNANNALLPSTHEQEQHDNELLEKAIAVATTILAETGLRRTINIPISSVAEALEKAALAFGVTENDVIVAYVVQGLLSHDFLRIQQRSLPILEAISADEFQQLYNIPAEQELRRNKQGGRPSSDMSGRINKVLNSTGGMLHTANGNINNTHHEEETKNHATKNIDRVHVEQGGTLSITINDAPAPADKPSGTGTKQSSI